MLKRTALFESHHAAGAKLVDFGGWEMPLHYGSQLEEHHGVRQSAGVFDVAHMRAVDLEGLDAQAFLQLILANDVAKLVAGQALYSCMLNPEGGVIDDLIVYRREQDRSGPTYRIVVNAATADGDIAWMQTQLAQSGLKATLSVREDLGILAVQGPQAAAKLLDAAPHWAPYVPELGNFRCVELGDQFLGRTGYTGEDGFEWIMPVQQMAHAWSALLAHGVMPCGLGARDTLRLEAGMNLYGQDMDTTVTPLECGLTWTVDRKTERHFIGRAALDAKFPRFQMLGIKLLDRGVMRAHMPLRRAGGDAPCGETTSGTFSPTLDISVGFARVPTDVSAGDALEVEIRGRWYNALAVKLPFVRRGQVLV